MSMWVVLVYDWNTSDVAISLQGSHNIVFDCDKFNQKYLKIIIIDNLDNPTMPQFLSNLKCNIIQNNAIYFGPQRGISLQVYSNLTQILC
jgi:hypothetical protein